jgi:4-alpha-glucanotransferase
LGWIQNTSPQQRQRAFSYLNCGEDEFNWTLIRAALASVANLAIVPLQDILGLGSEGRMNLPGTIGGNWTWRYDDDALSEERATRMAALAALYER